jgi:hypothetical protein
MEVFIRSDGTLRCLYTEDLDLAAFGSARIERASRVEPTPDGRWSADLSPASGPVLGPFARRSEALKAEATWVEAHALG